VLLFMISQLQPRVTNRQTDRQTRAPDRQTDRQTDRETVVLQSTRVGLKNG